MNAEEIKPHPDDLVIGQLYIIWYIHPIDRENVLLTGRFRGLIVHKNDLRVIIIQDGIEGEWWIIWQDVISIEQTQ